MSYYEQPFAMCREAMPADATIPVMAAAADRDDTTGISEKKEQDCLPHAAAAAVCELTAGDPIGGVAVNEFVSAVAPPE